jgi:acyl carrier protein
MPEDLETRLKQLIVNTLDLRDVDPSDISDDQPLMGADLGLDSIDALELVVQIEREFGIKHQNMRGGKGGLQSVRTMAEQIRRRQSQPSRCGMEPPRKKQPVGV